MDERSERFSNQLRFRIQRCQTIDDLKKLLKEETRDGYVPLDWLFKQRFAELVAPALFNLPERSGKE